MARYYGKIGFALGAIETAPGVWSEDEIVERMYFGEVLKNVRRYDSGDKVNDDLRVQNRISIVADDYFNQNLSSIKYLEWQGVKWKITEVEFLRPRLILTLGGVYNGPTP